MAKFYDLNQYNIHKKLFTMKKIIKMMMIVCLPVMAVAQQNYADFEKGNLIKFGMVSGKLDTASKNPRSSEVNKSLKCAKYIRDKNTKFDNIKIYPTKKMSDVSAYATHEGFPSKLSMKVYTSAPVGTLIEMQLGSKTNESYPSGINSQFQGYTTVQNQWENVVFTFAQTPEGSMLSSKDVDMINLMFAPGAEDGSIYFFDDIMGPDLISETGENLPAKE